MKGIYIEPSFCFECYNYNVPSADACKECLKDRKHKAKILRFGLGEKYNKMIVLLDNGIIKTINDYEIKDIKE